MFIRIRKASWILFNLQKVDHYWINDFKKWSHQVIARMVSKELRRQSQERSQFDRVCLEICQSWMILRFSSSFHLNLINSNQMYGLVQKSNCTQKFPIQTLIYCPKQFQKHDGHPTLKWLARLNWIADRTIWCKWMTHFQNCNSIVIFFSTYWEFSCCCMRYKTSWMKFELIISWSTLFLN